MCRENYPDEDQSLLLTPGEVADAALFFFSPAAHHVRSRPRGWRS